MGRSEYFISSSSRYFSVFRHGRYAHLDLLYLFEQELLIFLVSDILGEWPSPAFASWDACKKHDLLYMEQLPECALTENDWNYISTLIFLFKHLFVNHRVNNLIEVRIMRLISYNSIFQPHVWTIHSTCIIPSKTRTSIQERLIRSQPNTTFLPRFACVVKSILNRIWPDQDVYLKRNRTWPPFAATYASIWQW
jgi:hypothetical protein